MTTFFEQYLDPVNLNTNRDTVAEYLISIAKIKIDLILDQIKEETFDYYPHSFQRDPKSQLTKVSGIYLIVNQKTKKVYIGSTNNLSQRKGEHKKGLNSPGLEASPPYSPSKSNKVLAVLLEDLLNG